MAYGGTSLVTTELAAITAPSPIAMPPFSTTSFPIQTSFPIIGFSGLVMNGFNVQLRSNSLLANLSNSPL